MSETHAAPHATAPYSAAPSAAPPLVVVGGVSGSGKSTVGSQLAATLGVPFIDGDSLHSAANIEKMSAGHPLTDDDRLPWLETVGRTLGEHTQGGLVVACSALRRRYRELIRAEAPGVFFVVLTGPREVLEQRLGDRPGHFMPASLLDSQLATLEPLEPGEHGAEVGFTDAPADIVTEIETALGR